MSFRLKPIVVQAFYQLYMYIYKKNSDLDPD